MSISRRSFIAGSSAAAAIPLASKPVLAELSLGSATLTTVSDGTLALPGAFAFGGLPADILNPLVEKYNLNTELYEPECNLALYRDGTNTVLFDVGSGPDFMPSAGSLVESLSAVDLAPEDITHVLFTHAHPDHIWGLLDDFDEPLFYDAEYMMGRAEWDYWWNPETVNTIGEERAAFAVGAKRRMEAIESQVTLVDPDSEVLPGIAARASYGHTPGHLSFEIAQAGNTAMIVGDALANHHVAFHHPDLLNGSDHIGDQAVKTRKQLLDRLSNEKMPVIGFHLPDGGIGRVEALGTGYRYVSGA